MEVFIEAAVNPSRFYSKQLLRRVSSQYDMRTRIRERIMAVIDYISGMTDIYALDIYQKDQRNQSAYCIRKRSSNIHIFTRLDT